jgi:hypothetical protein
MRKVQLRRMRQRKTVWVLGALVLLALGALWWWASQRPPSIVIPPRQYPPNNAYDAYKRIAQVMYNRNRQRWPLSGYKASSMLFNALIGDSRVPQEEWFYSFYRVQLELDFLDAYRKHLNQPSVAVYEYDLFSRMPELAMFPELEMFREIACLETIMIYTAFFEGREQEAVQRIQTLMRFSEQIRTDGTTRHYALGSYMISIGLTPLRTYLFQVQSPQVLDTITNLARDYEQRRAHLKDAIRNDYYLGLSFYRDLAAGRITPNDLKDRMSHIPPNSQIEQWLLYLHWGRWLIRQRALREYQEYHERVFAELEKPSWERKLRNFRPTQRLNKLLFQHRFGFAHLADAESRVIATVRLLGCYAAVKRYYQQRKAYPPSLEALRSELGEMIIDPFTGKPFVYRVDSKRGFQLYSVGENRADDGGVLSADQRQGDLLPINENALPKAQRPARNRLSAPVWLR